MMDTTKTQKRISNKAKIIFIILPIFGFILIELFGRLLMPINNNQNTRSDKYIEVNDGFIPPKIIDPQSFEANFFLQLNLTQPELPFHKTDNDLYWRLKPLSSFTFRIPKSYIVNYKINSLGFRNKEFSIKKPKDKLRIICAGDSSTFGYFLNYCDTYPYLLETMLDTFTKERNAEVINAGTWCYSSYQGSILVEKNLIKLDPDFLIYSYGFNDSQMMNFPDSFRKRDAYEPSGFKKFLSKFLIYKFLENIIDKYQHKDGVLFDPNLVPRVNLTEYKDNLNKIVKICKQKGVKLIFLPISVPAKYYAIMREIADNSGSDFIDMESIFRSYYDRFQKEGSTEYEGKKFGDIFQRKLDQEFLERFGSDEMMRIRECNYIFMDHCHPTPVGNMIIAEELYDLFIKHNYFSKTDRILAPFTASQRQKLIKTYDIKPKIKIPVPKK
jgi:lysophospholipase L1-like esterase